MAKKVSETITKILINLGSNQLIIQIRGSLSSLSNVQLLITLVGSRHGFKIALHNALKQRNHFKITRYK